MRGRPRLVLALAAAAALAVVVGAVALGGGSGAGPGGARAPALPAAVLQGPAVTLASLRGRPAVVHFWASWCDPCRREAPELARLPAALGRRAAVVGVDWNDPGPGARRFLAAHHWRFPVLRDPDGTVGDRWGLSGLPVTFILTSAGRVAASLRGPQTVARVVRALDGVT